jgi:ATP synthase protein I
MIIKPPTRTLAATQAVATLVLAGAATLLLGPVAGYSALLGGLISLAANAWFARKVFSHSGARAVETVVRNAYLGELSKLILTGTAFALVFVLVDPLSAPGLFGGFILVHGAGLLALVRHARLKN